MIFDNTANPLSDQPKKAGGKKTVTTSTISSATLQIERKSFVFQLQENARGRLLRISEGKQGQVTAIVIPASGLLDFKRILDQIIDA